MRLHTTGLLSLVASAMFLITAILGGIALWFSPIKSNALFSGLPITTILLGVADYLTTDRSARSLSALRRGSKRPLPPFLVAVNLALLVLPTVLIALGAPYLGGGVAKCQLKDTWQAWYSAHDENAIKGIQSSLQCCGFGKATEMPFPFYKGPLKKGPGEKPEVPADTCAKALGRNTACGPLLEDQLKVAFGLVIGASVLAFIFRFAFILITVGYPRYAQRLFAAKSYDQTGDYRAIEEIHSDDDGDNDDEEPVEEERGRLPYTTTPPDDVPALENGANESTRLFPRSYNSQGNRQITYGVDGTVQAWQGEQRESRHT
ncbi:hypothetical protein TWF481_006666 [Arthrobotrys musiformis]|uniref:Tetraspanin Tsp3 n=1 Tax=Arthrobotrys musiformis TaxID=47236 RepID=A0AAV9W968_9PEZI